MDRRKHAIEFDPPEAEILDAIAFYSSRGWSWLRVVAFISTKHISRVDDTSDAAPSNAPGRHACKSE